MEVTVKCRRVCVTVRVSIDVCVVVAESPSPLGAAMAMSGSKTRSGGMDDSTRIFVSTGIVFWEWMCLVVTGEIGKVW